MSRQFTRDYFHEVTKGNVANVTTQIKFGLNDDIDAATNEDMWSQGGTLSYLSSAETMNIVSASTNDDGSPVGTGARTVIIIGLDGSFDPVQETVTMNGTTNVTTANSYIRVFRIFVATAGSVETNDGIITATASTAATIQAHMPAGYGQTQQCLYTIKNGANGYILRGNFETTKIGGGGNPVVAFYGEIRTENGAWRRVFKESIDTAVSGQITIEQPVQVALPAKTDLRIVIDTDTNNTSASGRLFIVEDSN